MNIISTSTKLSLFATVLFLAGCGGGSGEYVPLSIKLLDPPTTSASYKIAYSQNVFMDADGELHVYTHPAGSDSTIVSGEEVEAFDYNSSAGKIVYDYGQYLSQTKLRTINTDGTGDTLLYETENFGDIFPSWAPDGTKVSFSRYDSDTGGRNIYAVNADGTGLTEVVGGSTLSLKNSWSPDSDEIVTHTHIIGSDPTLCLVVAAADGSTLDQITSAAGVDIEPMWSPDGSRILFARSPDGYSDFSLYVYNVSTQQTAIACTDCTDNNGHIWSPTGDRIATAVRKPTEDVLYIIDADDGTFDEYDLNTSTNSMYFHPADWSSDGKYILIFSSENSSVDYLDKKLQILEVSTGTMTELVDFNDKWDTFEAIFLD